VVAGRDPEEQEAMDVRCVSHSVLLHAGLPARRDAGAVC
jgi:hypothetical protein